jgi:hypothetical protein
VLFGFRAIGVNHYLMPPLRIVGAIALRAPYLGTTNFTENFISPNRVLKRYQALYLPGNSYLRIKYFAWLHDVSYEQYYEHNYQ